jgi:Uma2 family endonuclease
MDRRYELMDGELCMMPAPTTIHQKVSQNIEFLLVQHVRAMHCGQVLHAPVDVVLGEGSRRDVVQPDVIFVASARAAIITPPEIVGAPDLVVEILSPGTEDRDRGYKRTLYERSGVREYWIVNPDEPSIEVYRLSPTGFAAPVRYGPADVLVSAAVPDFRLPVVEAFRTWL